ncbi:deoxyguanosinetriphosphate triphosphohydrolase [Nemorincola caseinilytica]|uniref:Deoxyguanosinetriphosphate triphosphohydrolase n=1 Tax=Nemorincola caseinilytica TaxID=2054315 RepID=A0ABP8N9W0_9BACT
MNWQSLYTTQRTGSSRGNSTDPVRNSFLRDYDRIIFSSGFRRLQNKTQVFPLPGAIFVHNRLTHSLEVASVGRSLGKAAGEQIAARHACANETHTEFYRYELASVIASACLAHDIGNPPFGHSGEDAIRAFFRELEGDNKKIIEDNLSPNQRRDLEYFEGNSNAFRILTHNFNEPEPGGYRLTYTTLAALVKYPCTSAEGFNKNSISTKKSGFFDSEIDTYTQIAAALGIPRLAEGSNIYARHPFVYLTEAADDICYRVIDLEDAHRLRIVSTDTFMDLFLPFFDGETGPYTRRSYIDGKLAAINDDNQKVQYIRARWIGLMVDKLAAAFMAHEEQLLAGTLDKDLLKCLSPADHELIGRINTFSVENIYNYRSVVEIEVAGYNVIGGLLRELVQAVLHPGLSKSGKVLKIIPAQFPVTGKGRDVYGDVRSVVDFISGMTDLYAIDLYRKMTGISIPDIR